MYSTDNFLSLFFLLNTAPIYICYTRSHSIVFLLIFFVGVVTASLICYLIWREVKYAAIVGVVGLLLKTVPIQTGLSKISSVLRYVEMDVCILVEPLLLLCSSGPGRGNFIHYVRTRKLRVV